MCPTQRNAGEGSVVGRAVALLAAFGPQEGRLGYAELARRTGLPKSTVHRLAGELADYGLLERKPTGVCLGLRLFELGQRVPQQRSLRDAALPYMADLREATRQTVHLAVLEGPEVVYIEILRGPNPPPLPSQVGGRLPAHATGVGKAMLAFSPPAVIDALLAGKLARVSSRTIVAPGLLRCELERVRHLGVAYDQEESGAGIVCAASPVLRADGSAAAAVSLSGWSSHMNLDKMAPAVRTAALALSRSLYAGGQVRAL